MCHEESHSHPRRPDACRPTRRCQSLSRDMARRALRGLLRSLIYQNPSPALRVLFWLAVIQHANEIKEQVAIGTYCRHIQYPPCYRCDRMIGHRVPKIKTTQGKHVNKNGNHITTWNRLHCYRDYTNTRRARAVRRARSASPLNPPLIARVMPLTSPRSAIALPPIRDQ